MKNSSDVAKHLTVKLQRRIRASHVDECAVKMGKKKMLRYDNQTIPAHYFTKEEIEEVERLI